LISIDWLGLAVYGSAAVLLTAFAYGRTLRSLPQFNVRSLLAPGSGIAE
jgi:hypothetical protein